jgi:hypothetical protein
MTNRFCAMALVATITIGIGETAASADDRPRTIAALLDCRGVTDDTARLQCYDRASARLSAARQSGELVTLDGTKVVAAKRQKFGMPTTRVRATASAEGSELAELQQIESTIVSVRLTSYDRYLLSLANGGVWETAEPLSFAPAVKSPIRIVRAGFGGFRATAGKGRSFLVKRVG